MEADILQAAFVMKHHWSPRRPLTAQTGLALEHCCLHKWSVSTPLACLAWSYSSLCRCVLMAFLLFNSQIKKFLFSEIKLYADSVTVCLFYPLFKKKKKKTCNWKAASNNAGERMNLVFLKWALLPHEYSWLPACCGCSEALWFCNQEPHYTDGAQKAMPPRHFL